MRMHFPQFRQRRGALQTIELLIALPVLILIVCAIFEFGLMFLAQQRLLLAADVVGRSLMANQGQSAQSHAESVMFASLGDVAWSRDCELELEVVEEVSGLIRVTTHVPATRVAPDLLAVFGLGIGERLLTASVVVPTS